MKEGELLPCELLVMEEPEAPQARQAVARCWLPTRTRWKDAIAEDTRSGGSTWGNQIGIELEVSPL